MIQKTSVEWAKELLSSPDKGVILDTETTGLGSKDEVIQVAVLGLNGEVMLDSLIYPAKRKTPFPQATAIHGMTLDMLKGAPTYPELAPLLAEILENRFVIAYNAQFDKRLLEQTAKIYGEPLISCKWVCALQKYRSFVWEKNYKVKSYKLQNAKHNALGDCEATLRVIEKMARG